MAGLAVHDDGPSTSSGSVALTPAATPVFTGTPDLSPFPAADKDKPCRFGDLHIVETIRVCIVEARGLQPRSGASSAERNVFCLVKMDREEVFQSSVVRKTLNPVFGDSFEREVPRSFRQLHFYLCDQPSSQRTPRPFARLSFRKRDLGRLVAANDQWHPLRPHSRHHDVTGKVCLEIGYVQSAEQRTPAVRLRVVDVCDVQGASTGWRQSDLYALASVQGAGRRLPWQRLPLTGLGSSSSPATSYSDSAAAACVTVDLAPLLATAESDAPPADAQLKVALYSDSIGGFNSCFLGEVGVPLDSLALHAASLPGDDAPASPQAAWYYLRPRSSTSSAGGTPPTEPEEPLAMGELKLRLNYAVDHVLPSAAYSQLWALLLDAAPSPLSTPAGLLQVLPRVDLEAVARPLMKVAVHSDHIRPLVRLLAAHEISQCQDVFTLFRSSSLASRVINELMKFIGHQYLLTTLKSSIDKIYLEKKSCEIDPVKLPPNENVEENTQNLIVYTEQLYSRVVDSNHRCPALLKEVFADLREVTAAQFPGRLDVQRQVLSSFLIMRFFAAAILNPKLFCLKRDNAEPAVGRTLALASKVLQRQANAVVCGGGLSRKEPWLERVLSRFTDAPHRQAMQAFLDRASLHLPSDPSLSSHSVAPLKDGILTQRDGGRWARRCLRLDWLRSRRRHCLLNEVEFVWAKRRGGGALGRLPLADVTAVEAVGEAAAAAAADEGKRRHVFAITTATRSVHLEAPTSVDMAEWMAAVVKQCRRQRLLTQQQTTATALYEVYVERELEAIHMVLLSHAETLRRCKNALEGTAPWTGDAAPKLPFDLNVPVEALSLHDAHLRQCFYDTLQAVLSGTFTLERAHREAAARQLKQMQYGSKEHPIGDDNYYLLSSRVRHLSL